MGAAGPALVSTGSPLGAWLDDTVEDTDALPGGALDLRGRIVKPLAEEISAFTTDLRLLPICLNARTMLNSATVVLR
ncbi:MAG: hypothetical protein HWE37_21660 [Rhodobacteraceae bacterium]|nr:hypothetical protein [Paracoccaceae bacterium]